MKLSKSYIFAVAAIVVIVLWFWSNSKDAANTAPAPKKVVEAVMPAVVIEPRTAEDHLGQIQLYGRTEANRVVEVKAETAGLVKSTPVKEGSFVRRGALLCRQDVDARRANLDQARANLEAREFDQQSTQTLVDKGYKSAIQLKSLQAAVDGARAAVKQAEIELDNVNMRAPFAGIFDSQMAEIGDYLGPGQACGKLIEMDPLIVVAQLSETQIGTIKLGDDADIILATGETLTGTIRFIESRANPSTRTFRAEIAVPNKALKLKGGVTATIRLGAGSVKAQHVPSKILSLNNAGTVGIRYLDYDDIVRFAVTKTIDEDMDGVWVTGLPDSTRIIVQGQDYVSEGTKVDPRRASSGTISQ